MKEITKKRLAVSWVVLLAVSLVAAGVFVAAVALMSTGKTPPVAPGPVAYPPGTTTEQTTPDSPDGYVFTGEGPREKVTKIGGMMTRDGIEVRANNLRMEYTVGSAAACVDVRIANYRDVPVPYTDSDWRIQTPTGMAMPVSYQKVGTPLGSGTIPPDHGVSGTVCRMGTLTDPGEYMVAYSPDIAMMLSGQGPDRVTADASDMTFFGWRYEKE